MDNLRTEIPNYGPRAKRVNMTKKRKLQLQQEEIERNTVWVVDAVDCSWGRRKLVAIYRTREAAAARAIEIGKLDTWDAPGIYAMVVLDA